MDGHIVETLISVCWIAKVISPRIAVYNGSDRQCTILATPNTKSNRTTEGDSLCFLSVLEDQRHRAHQAFPAVQEDPEHQEYQGLQHLPEEEMFRIV